MTAGELLYNQNPKLRNENILKYSQCHDPAFGFRWREDFVIIYIRPTACSEPQMSKVEKSIFFAARVDLVSTKLLAWLWIWFGLDLSRRLVSMMLRWGFRWFWEFLGGLIFGRNLCWWVFCNCRLPKYLVAYLPLPAAKWDFDEVAISGIVEVFGLFFMTPRSS